MFRWSYIIPRAIVAVLFFLFASYGVHPLLHWSMVTVGQTATGAKVDLDSVRLSLAGGDLELGAMQVTNPKSPMKNLFEFSSATFDLDSDALLRKRLVITQGRITGLEFGSDRETSGELEKPPEEPEADEAPSQIATGLRNLGDRWLENTADRLQSDVRERFESVRVTEDLIERWPAEYARLKQQADDWKARIENLQRAVQELRKQPLQELEYYQQRLAELDAIRREVPQIRDDLRRLKEQALADRDAIRQARMRDVQTIRETLRLEELDSQSLTEYLLGEECTAYVSQLSEWIRRGRTLLNTVAVSPDLNKVHGDRGETILFDTHRPPHVLVRSLALEGRGNIEGRAFQFLGSVRDLTFEPRRHDQPAVLELASRGDVDVHLRATFDHRGDVHRERFVIDVPRWKLPGRTIGKKERLALAVAPGYAHLWMQLDLTGEKLDGQLIMKQDQVGLTPVIASKLGGERVTENVQAALNEVHKIHAAVQLAGTLRRPQVQLQSNLGPQVAAGLRGAFHRELAFRRDQLIAKADRTVAEQTAKLDQMLKRQEQELVERLNLGEGQLDEFKTLIAGHFGLPADLTVGELLRRSDLLQKGRDALRTGEVFRNNQLLRNSRVLQDPRIKSLLER